MRFSMKNFINFIYLLMIITVNLSIAADKPQGKDDVYASYGGEKGHRKFVEHREGVVKIIADSIPAYLSYSKEKSKHLSVCYQKHIAGVGEKRKQIAKETATAVFHEYGLPREQSREMFHTPTDALKHTVAKQTALSQMASLLKIIEGTKHRTSMLEDDFSKVQLRILTPDQWPVSAYNETLKDSDTYKNTGLAVYLPAYQQVMFYSIFGKMMDIFLIMGPSDYTLLVKHLIQRNPLMNFKDISNQAMETFKLYLSRQEKSVNLIHMQTIIKNGADDIPMTSVYCFIPSFPKASKNGITQDSVKVLESGIFAPFIEHTHRYLFPRIHPIAAVLWERSILLEAKTTEALIIAYAKFAYVFFGQMPFARGSAAIGEYELDGIQLHHVNKKTMPGLVFPLQGLQKLDQVALGGVTFSQFLEHFKKIVKVVTDQQFNP